MLSHFSKQMTTIYAAIINQCHSFPNLSKTIKRLIHATLTMFLNSNSILFETQFGCRHSHSIICSNINHRENQASLQVWAVCSWSISWLTKGI